MKEIYESPKTTLRKVVMESSCMTASNPEKMNTEVDAFNFKTNQQGEGATYGTTSDNVFGGSWSFGD